MAAALDRGTEGYRTVGRVLRALQAHDGRLAETPARFVKVYEPPTGPPLPVNGEPDVIRDRDREDIQRRLELEEAEQGISAHVAAASGLPWLPTESEKIAAFEALDIGRSAMPVRVYRGAAGGAQHYFPRGMPVALDSRRAVFVHADPGYDTTTALRSWRDRHQRLWEALRELDWSVGLSGSRAPRGRLGGRRRFSATGPRRPGPSTARKCPRPAARSAARSRVSIGAYAAGTRA